MKAAKTSREEVESIFGPITDEQWQLLKESVKRHLPYDRLYGVVGIRVRDGRVYHPSDVEFITEN